MTNKFIFPPNLEFSHLRLSEVPTDRLESTSPQSANMNFVSVLLDAYFYYISAQKSTYWDEKKNFFLNNNNNGLPDMIFFLILFGS